MVRAYGRVSESLLLWPVLRLRLGSRWGASSSPTSAYTGGTAIWQCDTADLDDAGTAFQAYIDSKSYAPWGLSSKGGTTGEPIVIADPSEGVTIQLTIHKDEGADSASSTADLTDHSESAAATKVFPKFQSAVLGDSHSFKCRIGDAQATANAWSLDALIVPVSYQGE
jgi:hypothetical protein